MIIWTTSRGSSAAGDGCVVEVFGGALFEDIFQIAARVRYQTRLMSSSNTVAVVMVKWSDEKRVL